MEAILSASRIRSGGVELNFVFPPKSERGMGSRRRFGICRMGRAVQGATRNAVDRKLTPMLPIPQAVEAARRGGADAVS